MLTNNIKPTSRIEFHILKWSKEKDLMGNTSVIRVNTDEGLVLDSNLSEFLTNLYRGHLVKESADMASISMDSAKNFISDALDNNFIKSIDNVQIQDRGKKITPWLTKAPRKYFSWVINPVFILISFLIIACGFLVLVTHPLFFPYYKDLIWHKNIVISAIGLVLINYVLIFIHEFAHFATTRALGGQASMRINRVSVNVVVETEQYHMAVMPRRARYITYIAGLYADLLIVSLIFCSYYFSQGFMAYLPILKVIILLQFNAIIWEFGTFVSTDIYYFFNDLVRQDDIKLDAKKYLFLTFNKFNIPLKTNIQNYLKNTFFTQHDLKNSSDFRSVTPSDKSLYLEYYVMSMIGNLFTMITFLAVTLPKYVIFTSLLIINMEDNFLTQNYVGMLLDIVAFVVINDNIIMLPFLFLTKKE